MPRFAAGISNKSAGPFSIPVGIFKLIKFILSKPLETVLNASFITGVVPDKFKIARVYSNVSNYRPISLLSIFSKVLEKLMYSRLIEFIEKQNIL